MRIGAESTFPSGDGLRGHIGGRGTDATVVPLDNEGYCYFSDHGYASPSCAPFYAGGGACPKNDSGGAPVSFCVKDTSVCAGGLAACWPGPKICFPLRSGEETCKDGSLGWQTCPCS